VKGGAGLRLLRGGVIFVIESRQGRVT